MYVYIYRACFIPSGAPPASSRSGPIYQHVIYIDLMSGILPFSIRLLQSYSHDDMFTPERRLHTRTARAQPPGAHRRRHTRPRHHEHIEHSPTAR